MKIEHETLVKALNDDQEKNYDSVIRSTIEKKGDFFSVYGHGGTSKTYLYKTIISKLRSEEKIVLAVASSGIASLLLPGGRTTHSKFDIPIELFQNSTCGIKQKSDLAWLLQQTDLIIWDEAPMTHRYAFEALDKSLRDIVSIIYNDASEKIFGGKTVLFGGDFRQILQVIPKGKRKEIVQSSINRSYLWDSEMEILKQQQKKMRITQLEFKYQINICLRRYNIVRTDYKMQTFVFHFLRITVNNIRITKSFIGVEDGNASHATKKHQSYTRAMQRY
ncbi:uncharacterized protein LOC126668634 [Mercurialis annua]|uniref:uncharacterized protein LOC126668634 n=1 Tax=Mercurialis annua TaxID=3986 RepID=UPI00215EE607|nr:uncharacterized protein LOC126668634 [Mercurialis annua]